MKIFKEKSMKTKILSILLILLILLSVSVSCAPKYPEEPENIDLVLFDANQTEFSILRPSAADEGLLEVALTLHSSLNKYTQDKTKCFNVESDWIKNESDIPKDEYEILLGYTNRPESEASFKNLKYNEYNISVRGKRICISAYTKDALSKAVTAFTDYVKANTKEAKCVIPGGLSLTGSVDSVLAKLPVVQGQNKITAHDMGDNCSLIITNDMESSDYEAYKALILKSFTLHAENTIGENRFATFKDGEAVINTYYTPSLKAIRTTIEPLSDTALPVYDSEADFNTVTTPLLTQIGVEDKSQPADETQNGMSYVFRLSDGRFIIYDGGFGYSSSDPEKIRLTMKEQAPNPNKIVIAAWIITHAHGDHNAAFYTFVDTYISGKSDSEFTVQNVIRNTPHNDDIGNSNASIANAGKQRTAEEYLKSKGANIVKSHPGQVFKFADAKITVLYNLEMFFPRSFSYFNTSTTVTKLELGNQTFAMLGDCSEDASGILVKLYTNKELACDFVQVAHHGYAGGTTPLYRAIDPTYVLWPMGSNHYNQFKDHPRSAFLITGSTKVHDIYVAANYTHVFSLPFNGQNYTKTENRK